MPRASEKYRFVRLASSAGNSGHQGIDLFINAVVRSNRLAERDVSSNSGGRAKSICSLATRIGEVAPKCLSNLALVTTNAETPHFKVIAKCGKLSRARLYAERAEGVSSKCSIDLRNEK